MCHRLRANILSPSTLSKHVNKEVEFGQRASQRPSVHDKHAARVLARHFIIGHGFATNQHGNCKNAVVVVVLKSTLSNFPFLVDQNGKNEYDPTVKAHVVLPLFSLVFFFTFIITFFGSFLFGVVATRTLLSSLAASKEESVDQGTNEH